MKTTLLTTINLMLLALMLVGAVSCNERVPTNRPFLTGGALEDDDTDDEVVTRPNGQVFIQPGFCACNNNTNILVPDVACNNFCSTRFTNGDDRLYVTFKVGPDIELNEILKTTQGWCGTDLPAVDSNVRCEMVFKGQVDSDVVEEKAIAFTNFTGTGNSGWININDTEIANDRNYTVVLRATSAPATGNTSNTTQFFSDAIQIRKVSPGIGPIDLSPLNPQAVSQYACVNREQNPAGAFITAFQLHFYFVEQLRPDPLPPGTTNGFCHNTQTYGPNDSTAWPRLFEESNAFALWRLDDARLQNLRNPVSIPGGTWTNELDANEIIVKRVQEMGGTPLATKFFAKLSVSSGPTVSDAGNSTNTGALGWYMRMFIDSSTTDNFSVCLKEADYAGANKTFKAIGELVQSDTEALYLARRESASYLDTSVTPNVTRCVADDFILVRESDVRKHWFYFQNSSPKRPGTGLLGERAVKNNTMRFFYPFNTNEDPTLPPVKQADQKVFTIVTPQQASQPAAGCVANAGGIPQTPDNADVADSLAPHDKRLGCVPVSDSF